MKPTLIGDVLNDEVNGASSRRCEGIDATKLFQLVEDSLQEWFGPSPYDWRSLREKTTDAESFFVNITFRAPSGLRASMSGESSSWEDAIRVAVARGAADNRFSYALLSCELKTLATELWLRVDAEEFDPKRQQIALGLEGLEISSGGKNAYYKPSVAITSSMMSTAEFVTKLCVKADIAPEEVTTGVARFRRTHWLHFANVTGTHPVQMEGLRPATMDDVTPDTVKAATEAAATHLMNIQMGDGSFLYQLDVITNRALEHDEKHVRTAGCVYSLAAFANEYRGTALGERAEKSCRRAILYLLRHLESMPEERGAYVSYRSSSEGALGASALLLRALQFAPFREEFAQEHEQLRNAVLAMHRPNGTFRSRVAEDSDGPDDQDYYPGEALLALAVEEERNPEVRSVRETFGTALQYFRTSFAENPKTSYVLWHTECWARVSAIALRQNDRDFAANCIAFVKDLADYVCAMQLLDTAQTRTLGGFARSGKPTAASLAYAEGILHAAQPMKNAGDQETWIRYMYAGGLAFRFCLRLQIQPCQATFFSTPSNVAVGSVTTDLDRFSVRADNAQHLVTLGLQYLKVFEIYQ